MIASIIKSKYIIILSLIILAANSDVYAQRQKVQNRPYSDQKLYSFGFTIGLHTQDLILSHTGYQQANGEVWFAEIPSYSPGFSVGIIADRYINEHFNVRAVPTLYFGERQFTFREQNDAAKEFVTNIKSNYLSLPIHVKYSAKRLNNYRPYVLAGAFGNMQIGGKSNLPLKMEQTDYGLQFGLGCNFYLPMFKLCPEVRFSMGLKDLIVKDRSDLLDKSMLKYTEALSSGKSRMITVTLNFE